MRITFDHGPGRAREAFESPREIIAMLSDYFELMVDVIMRYDGYIKQYVGDEIMVIFGAPDDQPDHAARAVRAGVEMLEVLRKAERVEEYLQQR